MSEPKRRLRSKAGASIPDPVKARLRDPRGLRARVDALEIEVQENRQLNRRIAELTDVVAELLIPLEARDQQRVDEVLTKFREGL